MGPGCSSPVPPPVPRLGGRFRPILIVGVLLLAAAGVYSFVNVGRWLAREEPLTKADAIFVLAGTVSERPLEAADLYQAGYAPVVLLTRELQETATSVANQRGAAVPARLELNRDMLLRLGVPASALIVPERQHDSTAEEARTLREESVKRGWKRVIVVSSKYHLRRAAFACRRQLRGTGVEIIMRGTRYDPAVPERWWARRSDIRWVASEVTKFVAYSVGLGA